MEKQNKFCCQSRAVTLLQICEKTLIYYPKVDLVNDNIYTKFGKFCPFILKIMRKNQILTSIKGRNSVAKMRKMMIHNPNVDLVNDNVYTKFCLIQFIPSQDIEREPKSDDNPSQDIQQKPNSDVHQGP